ncbi:MAG: hypothetical protein V4563_05030 [Pseudomonadota bacterium]
MNIPNIPTTNPSRPSLLKEVLLAVLATVAYFLAAGLLVTLMGIHPSPTAAEISQQTAGQAMMNSDMRAAGFPGLALPPPSADGHIHLTPE